MKFSNGEVVHETWDGKDRWHKFTWEKHAKLVSAELDPTHQYLLDKDLYNNSYLSDRNSKGTHKFVAYWMIVTQWIGQMLAWLT